MYTYNDLARLPHSPITITRVAVGTEFSFPFPSHSHRKITKITELNEPKFHMAVIESDSYIVEYNVAKELSKF